MTKRPALILSMIFASLSAFAATDATEMTTKDAKMFNTAFSLFKGKNVAKVGVDKTVKMEVLDKTIESSGAITTGGRKIRWETETPEKSLILFDGKTLWTIQYPSEDLGGPVQVMKSKLDEKAKGQLLVRLMTSKDAPSKSFDVLKRTEADGGIRWDLKPKKEDATVKDFAVTVDASKKYLREIEYRDEIGNKTVLKFGRPEKVKDPGKKLFEAEIPKGAQVTDL